MLFVALLILRIINAFTIKTFFQPDEYFQSLEPAWRLAFGQDSGAWITWEWREQLRCSLHPILFAVVYRTANQLAQVLQFTPTWRAKLLVVAPKLLQAGIAASGDFYTWQLACRLYGRDRISTAALALTALSPWQWFCAVRTLSNSLEVTLTIAALYYWPWRLFLRERKSDDKVNNDSLSIDFPGGSHQGLYVSLVLAAVACILRPTNIIIWATISTYLLYRSGSMQTVSTLVQGTLICGSGVLVVSVSMDRTFYGQWTFPPLKFLYFNVVQSLSVFYGANRPDYYFTEGLPLLLTTALPFAAVGVWAALKSDNSPTASRSYEQQHTQFVLALTVITTVITMSLISHKEVRFIYPVLPILHILAARPLATFFHPFPMPAKKLRVLLMILVLAVNILIATYVSAVHQRGVIDVMHFLRHEHEARVLTRSSDVESDSQPSAMTTIGFLMPCHSTPWRSHLVHTEIHAWALTCEPPLGIPLLERQHYLDEADIFYLDPSSWIEANLKHQDDKRREEPDSTEEDGRRTWPEYLVFFKQLEPTMISALEGSRLGYEECWRGFNTQWHDDRRRQGDVVIWCMRS